MVEGVAEILKKKEFKFNNEPYILTYQYEKGKDGKKDVVIIHRIEKITKIETIYNGNGTEIVNVEKVKIYDKIENELANELISYVQENSEEFIRTGEE